MLSPAEIRDLAMARFREHVVSRDTGHEIRFCPNGKIAVVLKGPKAGCWVNHANRDERGNLLLESGLITRDQIPRPVGHVMPYKLDRERASVVRNMVAESASARGTVVDMYLRKSRKIDRPIPDCIRFLNDQAKSGRRCPAMLGLFTNPIGIVLGVSVTLISKWGTKQCKPLSYATGDGWTRFSAVRIPGEGDPVLCEGIETALSISEITGRPVWSHGADTYLASYETRFLPKRFSVADDGDKPESDAGRLYAKTIERWKKLGKEVDVLPTGLERGLDFNDLLKANKSK